MNILDLHRGVIGEIETAIEMTRELSSLLHKFDELSLRYGKSLSLAKPEGEGRTLFDGICDKLKAAQSESWQKLEQLVDDAYKLRNEVFALSKSVDLILQETDVWAHWQELIAKYGYASFNDDWDVAQSEFIIRERAIVRETARLTPITGHSGPDVDFWWNKGRPNSNSAHVVFDTAEDQAFALPYRWGRNIETWDAATAQDRSVDVVPHSIQSNRLTRHALVFSALLADVDRTNETEGQVWPDQWIIQKAPAWHLLLPGFTLLQGGWDSDGSCGADNDVLLACDYLNRVLHVVVQVRRAPCSEEDDLAWVRDREAAWAPAIRLALPGIIQGETVTTVNSFDPLPIRRPRRSSDFIQIVRGSQRPT